MGISKSVRAKHDRNFNQRDVGQILTHQIDRCDFRDFDFRVSSRLQIIM